MNPKWPVRTSWFILCLAFPAVVAVLILLFADARTSEVLRTTLWLALATIAISVPAGALLALLSSKTNTPGGSFLLVLLGVTLVLPLYLQAAAWQSGFGKLGWYTETTDIRYPWLSGWDAAVWVHALAAIPWAALLMKLGFAFGQRELEEQASLDAKPLQVLWYVSLPMAWGATLVAALWIGISVSSEMSVTDLFRVKTVAETVYLDFALTGDDQTLNWSPAWAMLGTAMVVSVVCWLWLLLPGSGETPQWNQWRLPVRRARWGIWLIWLAFGVLLLGLPVGSLIYKSGLQSITLAGERSRVWSGQKVIDLLWGGSEQPSVWSQFQAEYGHTLSIAAGGAALALALAIPMTLWAARRGTLGILSIGMLVAILVTIPGPQWGIWAVIAFSSMTSDLAIWAYDRTPLVPILTISVRMLPVTLLVLLAAFRSIPPVYLEMAEVDGARGWSRWSRIVWPSRRRAIGIAAIAAMLVGFADVAATILVLPPDYSTITVTIFRLLHYGVDDLVAGICLFNVLMVLLFFGILIGLGGLMTSSRNQA